MEISLFTKSLRQQQTQCTRLRGKNYEVLQIWKNAMVRDEDKVNPTYFQIRKAISHMRTPFPFLKISMLTAAARADLHPKLSSGFSDTSQKHRFQSLHQLSFSPSIS